MRNKIVGLMVLATVVAAMGVAEAVSEEIVSEEIASEEAPNDAAYLRAREQMADLLASEEFERVDISAVSFDRAMALIYMAVDNYLDQAVPGLGDVESAREFGVDVLIGLNDHKIRYAGDDGVSLVGKRRLLISGEQDAKDLGEVLARVAMLIDGGHGRPGINARLAAQRIFEGMVPVQGTGQSLVSQYVVTLRMLTKADSKALVDFALK